MKTRVGAPSVLQLYLSPLNGLSRLPCGAACHDDSFLRAHQNMKVKEG
ncbi:MAG: hypothetical protein GX425_07720 [Peptococcaceae bacterium]|nr:hypothetical protein [Peptococcaceae bacterium]